MRALLAVAALFLLVACGDDEHVTVTREPAPIESVEVRIAESSPPQYFLDVVSGLPSGCASFDRYDRSRAGDTIEVEVWNRIEAPKDGACTAIYGTVEHAIALGSDFQPGRMYTVRVNTVTKTFAAQ
ncbi:MAG TPA: hypothetical protein VFV33_08690 [Gemmatimonadaceae bacterium]|nr:hypothetical protein [Gemmatimonadaceae bacterium]